MPVDPQLQPLLDLLAASAAPPITALDPQSARALMANLRTGARVDEGPRIADLTIPGPAGELAVRTYTPPEGEGPFPLLLWFHGGGWVLGDLEDADPICRSLCLGARCVVVSVDYRLAPEHPFPAGLQDCHAALAWSVEQAADLGADPRRLAVGGDSAGGNLAAAVALLARDEGSPELCFQLLVYPVTDFDPTTPSMVENAEGYLLTTEMMGWFYDHYTDPAERDDPRAAPLRAADLSELPPALIITAEFDPLRDEGEAYGRRLAEAGVPTTVSRYDGLIHGFLSMTAFSDGAAEAEVEAARALAAAFGTS